MMRKRLQHCSPQLFLAGVLLLLVAALSLCSNNFLTYQNIMNIIEANNYRLILAVGMTIVMASGVMDLSAGAIVSAAGVVMALAVHAGAIVPVAVAAGLVAGLLLGLTNGLLIHFTKINFFILTLATCGIFRGISLIVTNGRPITVLGAEFVWLGIGRIGGLQLGTWLVLAVAAFSYPLLYHTKWGSYIMTLGTGHTTLERAGIQPLFYRLSVQALFGLLAAVTALLITAKLNSAEPNAGLNMELEAITAVVMGGTPLTGGQASIGGTVLAVLILGVIRNGLTLMSIASDCQQLITGALLLASVLVAEWRLHRH